MGASTFGAEQLDATFVLSLNQFASWLAMSLTPARAATEMVQAVLGGALLISSNTSALTEILQLRGPEHTGATAIGTLDESSSLAKSLAPLSPSQRQALAERMVFQAVCELTGAPTSAITTETPLMEAGIDSLAATELSKRLRTLTGVALSPTIVFEHPTPQAVTSHLLEQVSPASVAADVARTAASAANLGAPLALSGVVGRWPSSCNYIVTRWQLQAASSNAMSNVPQSRWTIEAVVDMNMLSETQTKCVRYGGFVAGAQRFDAVAFGVSLAEAGVMDPQQRVLLELGYAALHTSLHRRSVLVSGDSGVFLGIERPDWALAQPPSARGSVYAVTGDNVSVAAGRVSFVLGLQGPCSTVDTACSSALAAVHGGAYGASGGECSDALALAVSLKLVPHGTLGAASAGMLSVDGRCKTLDARANGYARSDGVGALVVRRGHRDVGVLLCGSAVRQDGRSASLTAPNGSAQRTLLRVTLGRASLASSELGTAEAHGTGTALGDPTEAGALTALHRDRSAPLTVGAAKANVGHSEAASGQVGLLKLMQTQLEGMAVSGNAHLRLLNPLVREGLGTSAQACFMLLPTQGGAACAANAGVSSFGYSGTIAHAVLRRSHDDLWGLNVDDHDDGEHMRTPIVATVHRRGVFLWCQPPHPFAQRRLSSTADGAFHVRSPIAGALHALVANHVVQGRAIFPGAGYLEMARAATAGRTALGGVFFLQPLAVEAGFLVECLVGADGRFEVRNGDGDEASANVAVHCSGAVRAEGAVEQNDVHASMRARSCACAADVGALYDGYDAIGLQYGPRYRTLMHSWSGTSGAMARLRSRSTQQGTWVHPADLDDAQCASALMSSGGGTGGETRLPFAVDDVLLRDAPASSGRLWHG
jgi:acyl transferase domain-containing protein